MAASHQPPATLRLIAKRVAQPEQALHWEERKPVRPRQGGFVEELCFGDSEDKMAHRDH